MQKILFLLFAALLFYVRAFTQDFTTTEKIAVADEMHLASYWLNKDFARCIGKGSAPCDCLSQNEIVMLMIDKLRKKVYLQSSVYFFGSETVLSADLKPDSNNWRKLRVEKEFPLSDSMIIDLQEGVVLFYKGDRISFDKYLYKEPEEIMKYPEQALWRRRNLFNAYSLSNYEQAEQGGSAEVLIDLGELHELIADEQVSISCSDDFRLNEMVITGEPKRYFQLEYRNDSVFLYEEKLGGRSKGEIIDLSLLKKQVLYRVKE